MGCVYELVFPNQKRYVGISQYDDPLVRFHGHCKKNNKSFVSRAINKYGPSSIEVNVLWINEHWDLLQLAERQYISVFNTKSLNGYNLTDGGDGILGYKFTSEQLKHLSGSYRRPSGWKHSTETLKKMRISHAGRISPKKGIPLSRDQKRKLSIAQKKRWARGDGINFTSAVRAKQSAGMKASWARRKAEK